MNHFFDELTNRVAKIVKLITFFYFDNNFIDLVEMSLLRFFLE